MGGAWLHPAFWWALVALAIPLLIHLWNRKQGRVIRVGSVQLHHATESARANRLRLHEILLWLVRSALVLALVAALVGYALPQSPEEGPDTLHLVDPALAEVLPEGFLSDEAQAYWLGSELTPLAEPLEVSPTGGWEALVALGQSTPLPDTVYVYTHLYSERWPLPAPPLPFTVVWRSLPQTEAPTYPVQRWNTAEGEITWTAVLEEYTTRIQTELGPNPNETSQVLKVFLDLPEVQANTLRSAIEMAAQYVGAQVEWTDSAQLAEVVFAWQDLPASLPKGTRWVQYQPSEKEAWYSLDPSHPHGQLWHHPIQRDAVSRGLWQQLPLALLEVLFPQPEVPHALPASALEAGTWEGKQQPLLQEKVGTLLLIVMILLMVERSLAAWRRA